MNSYHQMILAICLLVVSILLAHAHPSIALPILLTAIGVALFAFRK